MNSRTRTYISVFGVNHEDTDLDGRKKFSLSDIELENLYSELAIYAINNAVILNTCNRIEVYTESQFIESALQAYRKIKNLSNEEIHAHIFIKYDAEAIKHIFEVGAGMKSKVLGDYQIIGQIRSAFNQSKELNLISPAFERLFQSLFISCKEIKNNTKFNHGTASHGYQLVKLMQEQNISTEQAILIIGAGDMAQKTINHLQHNGYKRLAVANRTISKAKNLQTSAPLQIYKLDVLTELIQTYPVIINTIPLSKYVNKLELQKLNNKYIFDLTVTQEIKDLIAPELNNYWGIDEIEQTTQATIQYRKNELDKVAQIIEKHILNYLSWNSNNEKNQIFRLFESELENWLRKSNAISTEDTVEVPKQITQLFMKKYYNTLNTKKVS